MKTCSKCKQRLPESAFSKKRDGLQPYCRDCNREHSRAYYAANAERMRQQIAVAKAARQQRHADWICEYLTHRPCVDCGVSDIRVLQFDHLRDKVCEVGKMLRRNNVSLAKLQREIEKCEVVCANCHAIRTAERAGNHYRSIWLARAAIPG